MFSKNSAKISGGAVSIRPHEATYEMMISNTSFEGNNAQIGSAIRLPAMAAFQKSQIYNCEFIGNTMVSGLIDIQT